MFKVVFCILLLVIYMSAVADQLPRLGKRVLLFLPSFNCNYVFFCSKGFLLPLGALDWLRCFIVAFPEPSI